MFKKNRKPSKTSFYLKQITQNDNEKFMVEASKAHLSVNFRENLATHKTFLDQTNNQNKNAVQNNISLVKILSEKNGSKSNRKIENVKEKVVLPSILPTFKNKLQHKDNKKHRKVRNLSIYSEENRKKEPFSKGKYFNLHDFLNNREDVLVKNEEIVGNLVKYSTLLNKSQGNKVKKFYID